MGQALMKTLNVLDVVMSDGTLLRDRKTKTDERGTDSTYFQYHISSTSLVCVESTAKSVMEELLSLPVDDQKLIVVAIADSVPNPGDQVLIGGDRKQRGARVVRLASDNRAVVSILITY